MRAGAAALALAWAAAGRPATVEVSPRGDARRLRDKSVADPSVPGRVRTSAVAVGANLSGCAFVGEVNLGATMDMDVVSDALNHGALAAEAYRRLADEANRPPRCGVYVNGSVGLGRYAVAAHVYDAVDGKGAYYGDAPLRLAPRDLTVDGADRAFATPFHVDPDLDVSGLVKVVPTNNSLIISALGQILTELELSNVTFVFDESQEDWGGGWDDVDAYLLDSWGVVATKLTTEELVADVTVVDASHLLVVASYDPDSCEAEMDALDAGRLAPQAQLFVSCLDGLFAKEIVRGFAGQTERSYEVDAWHDRVEAVDGLTGESAGTLLDRLGTSYDLDWDPLSSETAVYALAALSATLQALEGSLASTDADDLNARLLAWLADQPAVATALGNLTFDASGQASVARAPVSQYTAEAEKKLVWYYGAAESAYLTWDQAECVYSHNCSNAGDCQGDGTCACRDGFSGDECAVKNCAPGSYYTAPSGKTPTDPPVCETCEPGTFTDAYGSDKCRICDLYSYAPDAGASSCLSCPANSKRYPPSAIDLAALASFDGDAIFEFLISHATSASHCICEMGTCEGKHCFQPLGEDGVASKCDFTECAEPIAGTGAYSPAAAVFDGAMTCYECPKNAYCRGAFDLPIPVKGFSGVSTVDVSRKKLLTWEHPLRMDRCASYEGDCQGNYNCPGSKAQGSLLCQATRAGFTTVGDMVIECPAGATGVVFQLLLSGGLVAAFFVVTHFSDKYEAVGIFLTHARSISIIAQVDVNWPKDPLLALFFNFMAATQFDVDIAPPRCFFAKWGFMERILVQLLLLLFMFGFYFFFSYLPTWYRHRGSGPELVRTAWNHLLKFCIASLVMTYPSLCEVSIASMICKEFDDGGAYLAQDLEMRCWTETEHTRQHRVVASLGFVMTPFLIGFPLWIYAVLVTKIKRNELMSTDSLERYGPMYSGFKPHIAWWSAVEIAKQLTLEALNQILRPLGPGITLWAYVLIQFIHVVSMAAYDPFLHAGEKGLQSALLSTAVVVIASASLFAYYGDEPSRHEEQHMLTVSYIVDGCLIVCLYITYSVVKTNIRARNSKDKLVAKLAALYDEVLADKPKPKRASLLDKMNDLKRPSIKTLADVRNSLEAVVKGDDNTGNYFADPDSEFYQTFCSECFLKWVDQADPKDPKTKELLEDILYVNEHLLEAYCRDDAEFGTYAVSAEAEVWQKLIAAFPNLFEWLVTDPSEAQIADFNALIEKLARLRRHYGMGSTTSVDPDWTFRKHYGRQARSLATTGKFQSDAPQDKPFMRLIHKEDRATIVFALCSVDKAVRERFFRLLSNVRLGQSMDPLDGGENVLEHFAPDPDCDAGPPMSLELPLRGAQAAPGNKSEKPHASKRRPSSPGLDEEKDEAKNPPQFQKRRSSSSSRKSRRDPPPESDLSELSAFFFCRDGSLGDDLRGRARVAARASPPTVFGCDTYICDDSHDAPNELRLGAPPSAPPKRRGSSRKKKRASSAKAEVASYVP